MDYLNVEEFSSPYSWKPQKVLSFTTCGKCGAVLNTGNVDVHVEWHRRLETKIEDLLQKVKNCERKNK